MKILPRLALYGLLCLSPAPLMLSGCGGGSNTPQIPLVTRTDRFTLSNGQNAVLVTNTRGRDLTGTLQILNEPTSQSEELPVGLPLGTYDFVGTFQAPRGFNVVGTLADNRGQFQLSGQLPLPTAQGSYALTIGGVTARGIIPALTAQ